jgi:hypothetical protein
MWQLGDNNALGSSWGEFLADDRLHPNDAGHRLMADMVVYMLQQTAIDLLTHPLTPTEIAASREPLPPPMFNGGWRAGGGACPVGWLLQAVLISLISSANRQPNQPNQPNPGNEASMQQVCAQGKNMSRHVVSSDSWSVVAFDKGTRFPTFGYESSTPGKPLVLEVDTTSPIPGGSAGVVLTYTKGKEGYGRGKIRWGGVPRELLSGPHRAVRRCGSQAKNRAQDILSNPPTLTPSQPHPNPKPPSCSNGCTCNTTMLEGAVPYDQIVVFLEEVHPTPAPQCHVSVELDPSSPAGSKVRISGAAITADPGHIAGRVGEVRLAALYSFLEGWGDGGGLLLCTSQHMFLAVGSGAAFLQNPKAHAAAADRQTPLDPPQEKYMSWLSGDEWAV